MIARPDRVVKFINCNQVQARVLRRVILRSNASGWVKSSVKQSNAAGPSKLKWGSPPRLALPCPRSLIGPGRTTFLFPRGKWQISSLFRPRNKWPYTSHHFFSAGLSIADVLFFCQFLETPDAPSPILSAFVCHVPLCRGTRWR